MKNLYLFLAFVLLSISGFCQSQSYIPIPESGAVWFTRFHGGIGISGTRAYESICGADTVINSVTYKKYEPNCNWTFRNDINGAVRNDAANKRVYFYLYRDSAEYLLYDFNLVAGDTISLKGLVSGDTLTRIVSHVNFDTLAGAVRRIIHFTHYGSFTKERWIEGLGSTVGFMFRGFDDYGVNQVSTFNCFYQNGNHVYTMTDTLNGTTYNVLCLTPPACGALLTSTPITLKPEIKVYPNPAQDFLQLENIPEGAEAVVFNLLGQQMLKQQVQNTFLNVSGLIKGSYLLRIIQQGKVIHQQPILIQR